MTKQFILAGILFTAIGCGGEAAKVENEVQLPAEKAAPMPVAGQNGGSWSQSGSPIDTSKLDAAIESAEKNYKSKAGDQTRALALADAYAELGDMDKALGLYKEAASYENQQLAPYYMYKLAIYHYDKGQKEEAKAMLEEIKTKYPESVQSQDAEKLLYRLQ